MVENFIYYIHIIVTSIINSNKDCFNKDFYFGKGYFVNKGLNKDLSINLDKDTIKILDFIENPFTEIPIIIITQDIVNYSINLVCTNCSEN